MTSRTRHFSVAHGIQQPFSPLHTSSAHCSLHMFRREQHARSFVSPGPCIIARFPFSEFCPQCKLSEIGRGLVSRETQRRQLDTHNATLCSDSLPYGFVKDITYKASMLRDRTLQAPLISTSFDSSAWPIIHGTVRAQCVIDALHVCAGGAPLGYSSCLLGHASQPLAFMQEHSGRKEMRRVDRTVPS